MTGFFDLSPDESGQKPIACGEGEMLDFTSVVQIYPRSGLFISAFIREALMENM